MIKNKINMVKMFFDLKSLLVFIRFHSFQYTRRAENEQWKNHFYSNHGFLSSLRIQQMRTTISRQQQNSIVHLLKSILNHGVRPIDLSRKPKRYRSLSQCAAFKTLSLWYPSAIAKPYKCRWQIELFIKCIKQRLRIKAF